MPRRNIKVTMKKSHKRNFHPKKRTADKRKYNCIYSFKSNKILRIRNAFWYRKKIKCINNCYICSYSYLCNDLKFI